MNYLSPFSKLLYLFPQTNLPIPHGTILTDSFDPNSSDRSVDVGSIPRRAKIHMDGSIPTCNVSDTATIKYC